MCVIIKKCECVLIRDYKVEKGGGRGRERKRRREGEGEREREGGREDIIKQRDGVTTKLEHHIIFCTCTLVGFCGRLPVLWADDGQADLTLLVYVGVVDLSLENNLSRKRNKHQMNHFDISTNMCVLPT